MISKRYIMAILPLYTIILAASLFISSAEVVAGGYPWDDTHSKPYDFWFGNDIDTHQQTKSKNSGELQGFLYITFTGVYMNGIPVAEHCDDSTPDDECVVGWHIRGKPGEATFVFHDNDHPIWLVSSRNDIPQPGSFTHFHWTGPPESAGALEAETMHDGYFLELKAVDKFYFSHHGDNILVIPGIDNSSHVNVVGSFPAP